MSLTFEEQQQITRANTEAFTAALKNVFGRDGVPGKTFNNPTGTPGTKDVSDVVAGFASGLTGIGKDVAGLGVGMSKGTATIDQAAGVLGNTLTTVGGTIGGLFGDAIKGTSAYMTDTIKNWREFSRMGVDLFGDSLLLEATIRKNLTTNEEFQSVASEMGASMFKFGATTNEGLLKFTEFNQTFLNDANLKLFARMGLVPKDMTEGMALFLRGANSSAISQAMTAQQVADAARDLTIQLQLTAKLTGMSNKEQEKQIEHLQNQALYQAALDQATPKQALAMNDINNNLAAYPQKIQDFVQESLATGGITASKNAQEITAGYGANFAQLVQRIGQLTKTGNEAEAQRLTREVLMPAFLESRRQGGQLVAGSGGRTAGSEAVLSSYEGANNPANVMNQRIKEYMAQNPGSTYQTAFNQLVAAGKIDLKGIQTVATEAGNKGEAPKGAIATEVFTSAENSIRQVGSVFATNISQAATDTKSFHNAMSDLMKEKFMYDPKGWAQQLIDNFTKKNETGLVPNNRPENADVANSSDRHWNGVDSNLMSNFMSSGQIGDLTKSYGAGRPLEAHGTEIPPMLPSQLSAIIQRSQKEMPNMVAGLNAGMNAVMPMLSGVLSKVPTTISSAGGSLQNAIPNIQESLESGIGSLSGAAKNISLSDLNDNLHQISKHMEQAVSEITKVVSYTEKTATNTKYVGGNVH